MFVNIALGFKPLPLSKAHSRYSLEPARLLFAEACIRKLRLLRHRRVSESDDFVAALEQRLDYIDTYESVPL